MNSESLFSNLFHSFYYASLGHVRRTLRRAPQAMVVEDNQSIATPRFATVATPADASKPRRKVLPR